MRTEAGLWAILEVWSDFRDAFTPQDVKLLDRVATALGQEDPRRLTRTRMRVNRSRGSFLPLVTPFRDDGALDLARLRGQPRGLRRRTTSPATSCSARTARRRSLDEDEKLALVRRRPGPARAAALLLVGTGLETTRATIALTRKAADLGADAALVLTPHYYKSRMTAEALQPPLRGGGRGLAHPGLLYSVPAFTGLPWPAGLAAARRPPAHRGMKESSGDIGLLGRIVVVGARAPSRWPAARRPCFYPALCLGASAGVAGRGLLRSAARWSRSTGLRGRRPRARAAPCRRRSLPWPRPSPRPTGWRG